MKVSKTSLPGWFIVNVFLCGILIIVAITLCTEVHTSLAKRIAIGIGSAGFLGDVITSVLSVVNLKKWQKKEEVRAMLRQVFGYFPSYAIPQNWETLLSQKVKKSERKGLGGEYVKGIELHRGISLCLEGGRMRAQFSRLTWKRTGAC